MLPNPNSSLTSLPSYVFAELDVLKNKARANGISFIDLGMGSPDSPTPPTVLDALEAAARNPANHGYPPFRGVPKFMESAAAFMQDRFGVTIDPVQQMLAISGSKEGLAQVAMAYCGPGDVALVPSIYYPVHARATLLNGGEVFFVPTPASTGFLPQLEEIPADVLKRAKILIVNYPNNPTGAVADKAFMQRAVEFAHQHNLVLVSDLAYSELTYDGFVAPSVFEIDGAMDVAVEFHSCSKSFNMAGMRVGFVAGNTQIIDTIAAYRTNVAYGTPTVLQYAAAHAFDNYKELGGMMRDVYKKRRDAVVAAFRSIGWKIDPPKAAMYIWLPLPEGYTDWEWTHALLDQVQVVVTPGLTFGPGGTGYFRISLVAHEDVLTSAIHRFANVKK